MEVQLLMLVVVEQVFINHLVLQDLAVLVVVEQELLAAELPQAGQLTQEAVVVEQEA
jgi:hypothetical protein